MEKDVERKDWESEVEFEDVSGNIGAKTKTIAQALFILILLAALIIMIIMAVKGVGWMNYLPILGGVVGSGVVCWVMYAFGELVNKACENERNTYYMIQMLKQFEQEKK